MSDRVYPTDTNYLSNYFFAKVNIIVNFKLNTNYTQP